MRKLFQLVGEISIAGIDLVNKQMRTMDKEARKVQRSIATLGRNMEKTGKAMTKYVTLPLLAAGAAVTKFGADFDKAMTSSLAIMGEVSEAMRKDMSMAAREVGKTTKFSATEAAEAYFFLASAGLSAKQSIEALPKVAAFAQAGQFDLSLATDLLTDAQSALGLVVDNVAKNMENMVMVSDVLVKANTLANASVQQFSEALTNKAGAALRVLGKEIEEGIAVLAVYADQGVKGAEAGSQLNIVMRDLQKAAIKNKEAFRAANVAVFDQEGEMRNLADIISDLENRLGTMSDEEKKAELMTLGFTEKSIAATVALIGTSDAIKEYETKLKDAAGITDEVSKKQLQNFWDQLGLVKSELIDIGLTIWQSLEPILTKKLIPALRKVTTFVKGVAEWFDKLNNAQKDTIIMVTAFVAAVGPMLLILGKAIIATKALTSSILLMNAALIANPFVLAAVAITAIGAAIYYTVAAWDEWKRTIADDIAEKQTSALKSNLEEIIPLYGELAAAAVAPMGKERFEEVNKKVKELETNLADLGFEFTGNFAKRAVEAENVLTDLLDTFEEGKQVIDRTADAIKDEVDEETKATISAAKAKAIKEEQIRLSKAMIQQRISETNNIRIQAAEKLKILEIEEKEALDKTVGGEEAKSSIRELYARKRLQLEEETIAKINAVKNKALEDDIKREEERTKLLEEKESKWKRMYKAAERQEQEYRDKVISIYSQISQAAVEFNNYVSDIINNYYQKKFNLLELNEQKEIQSVKNSQINEEAKEEAIASIKEKYAKKALKLRQEQAKKDKAFAIFSAIINTAMGIAQALGTIVPKTLAIIMSVIIGAMGAVQIAAIASQPLPMRRGAYVKGGRGGVQAEIGEGFEDEIVMPMKTGVQALAEALINKLNEFKLPVMGTPKLAMAGGGTMATGGSHRSGDINLNIGTLIADESGLKELERRLDPYRISNEQRKGRLYHGSR